MNHEELCEKAKEAISAVFGDTTVTRAETDASLTDIMSEIGAMLDSLDEDEDYDGDE